MTGIPVTCRCGGPAPTIGSVVLEGNWECPQCQYRWVAHNGRIYFLEPGQEIPRELCVVCHDEIHADQKCIPVHTGVPDPHVLDPETEYIHLHCMGIRL